LKQAVFEVCMDVAQAIVRDGEGATKFVTVEVNGGGNHQECLDVGYAVAHSPLIKTALFASDRTGAVSSPPLAVPVCRSWT
jgi:glutamate N-acetyltransferase/amino-acid N-acetyltransferase